MSFFSIMGKAIKNALNLKAYIVPIYDTKARTQKKMSEFFWSGALFFFKLSVALGLIIFFRAEISTATLADLENSYVWLKAVNEIGLEFALSICIFLLFCLFFVAARIDHELPEKHQ
ncbi:hypothetical protein E1162_15105 [Rhodobacteraceae bacterium RKSG542]|uniref:hypothetical protein n=1 Tax=Pseudovibrio flavus TaxID=2529854 RepID=UPI0012BD0D8A|nr:hypothetical protein [Pseudovibrio flavus]MTI18572.1 hypothetical protein [Pseudovibrio flavus]